MAVLRRLDPIHIGREGGQFQQADAQERRPCSAARASLDRAVHAARQVGMELIAAVGDPQTFARTNEETGGSSPRPWGRPRSRGSRRTPRPSRSASGRPQDPRRRRSSQGALDRVPKPLQGLDIARDEQGDTHQTILPPDRSAPTRSLCPPARHKTTRPFRVHAVIVPELVGKVGGTETRTRAREHPVPVVLPMPGGGIYACCRHMTH